MDQSLQTLEWIGGVDGYLRLIDQTKLPVELTYCDCRDVETLWEAIKVLRVRGAPAIGIAAAYGVVLGTRSAVESTDAFFAALAKTIEYLASSRPTAVNLFWALQRMEATAQANRDLPPAQLVERLLHEAKAVHDEDRRMCHAIGEHGAALIEDGWGVLTHCNAGGLATAEYGTALAVFYAAHEAGKRIHVYADETRPLLQGARLTAWELQAHGVPVTLICDNMAGQVMREGKIQAVVTGADRIAANGDAANKIGTYSVAVLAKHHGIPFYVAAPASTFDLSLADGSAIPIEQRDPREVTHGFGRQTAPEGVDVYNPAFDVTPAELIAGLITDRGVIQPVTPEAIRRVLGDA
ncbi:MAG: S-methyl-5-thioribose-1-phosphate isomerase [Planctomycetota bacterium]|nr:MAG: S-methyl-5-thioribose-1-phosphate isomerase [Planctomycetota bacterium]